MRDNVPIIASPLIAGAGPVGLAAALFLRRAGIDVRLIDRATTRSPYSRALAVNPRTLDLLEPAGVTDAMLARGLRVVGASFWRGGRITASIDFASLPHRFPFLLALSQRVTERLLEDALTAAGGRVERGVELVSCRDGADAAHVTLREADGATADARVPWLLAADGSRSAARAALELDFAGSHFDRAWHLADVPLETTTLAADRAHVAFVDGGFLFFLRSVDDNNEDGAPPGPPLWRVLSNIADPLERLAPYARVAGPAVWTSTFHIAHRVAARLGVGRVFLAGDAAHVHSPVGARGMNLGIEDAWAFARLARTGALADYGPRRHAVDRAVVRRIAFISRVARGESIAARFARRGLLPIAARTPLLRDQMRATLTGLDHDLP